jgi:hypothetical protein
MNELIPQDTIEYLRANPVTTATAARVLKMIIKNEKTSNEAEAEVYLVLQIVLASNYSSSKISELLLSLNFPDDFVSEFLKNLPSLPKIRAGGCPANAC